LDGPVGDGGIYRGHQAGGFDKGDNDLLVVLEVAAGKLPALAVLQPLRADLIAAEVELPNVFRDATEELIRVDPDAVFVRGLDRALFRAV